MAPIVLHYRILETHRGKQKFYSFVREKPRIRSIVGDYSEN